MQGAEFTQNAIDRLYPGDVIEISDIAQLAGFENLVARRLDPSFDEQHWSYQAKLRDLVRPPHFNGQLLHMKLQVMSNPYQHLLSVAERGFSFPSGGRRNYTLTSAVAETLIPRYMGFVFTADAISSGRGKVGQAQAEIYYYPVSPAVRKNKRGEVNLKQRRTDSGESIRRVVTISRLERDGFIIFDENARRIGFAVMSAAIKDAIKTPMQN